jgi:hypothetical protein
MSPFFWPLRRGKHKAHIRACPLLLATTIAMAVAISFGCNKSPTATTKDLTGTTKDLAQVEFGPLAQGETSPLSEIDREFGIDFVVSLSILRVQISDGELVGSPINIKDWNWYLRLFVHEFRRYPSDLITQSKRI